MADRLTGVVTPAGMPGVSASVVVIVVGATVPCCSNMVA